MATLFHPRPNYMPAENTTKKAHRTLLAVPLGRVFLSLIFIVSGLNHFSSGSISYADSQGIPAADILVPVSGLLALIGGLSVLTGLHARVGAVLLMLFMIPVTFLMHDFWNVADPQEAQTQMIHFLKNISILGGIVLVGFYGAGPWSLDQKERKKHH